LTSQIWSRVEYLMSTDNIIVFIWHFILTKKSNLLAGLNTTRYNI